MHIFLKYIICWSGGKDSTASVIWARLHNIRIDEIIFSEVMYDNKRGISGEQPCHIKFIKEKAIPLFESWGYKVTILRGEADYLSCFSHVIENPTIYEENRGKCSGFPKSRGKCSVKRDCKIKPINKYLSSYGEEYFEYVGIGIDEPERLEAIHKCKNKASILEMLGKTTMDARNLCKEYDLYSPSYQLTNRNGCWFCLYAKLAEMQVVRTEYPDVFKEFVTLEDRTDLAGKRWNPQRGTLKQVEDALFWEERAMTVYDVDI